MGKPAVAPMIESALSAGVKRPRDLDPPLAGEGGTTGTSAEAESRAAKRKACVHTVALPDGFTATSITLDERVHGVPASEGSADSGIGLTPRARGDGCASVCQASPTTRRRS
jgi:hypothetical protein